VLSIGVCDVAIPRTILAMTVCSFPASQPGWPLRDGTVAPRARQLSWARHSPTFRDPQEPKNCHIDGASSRPDQRLWMLGMRIAVCWLQPEDEDLLQICCRYSSCSQSRQLIVAMVRAPVRAILVSDKGRVL